jgi:spoIIIJ-associated protein
MGAKTMEYKEFKGKTKNDAIDEACRFYSIPSDKLDYVVLEEGKTGFLGMGAKPAVINARIKEEEEAVSASVNASTTPVIENAKQTANNASDTEVVATARKFLDDVFAAMKLQVNIDINYNESLSNLDIELGGEEMGVLIGKRGQTLDSLQYLVSLVVNKGTGEYIRVKVDTENYRQRRKETLENLAKNISYKVKRTRRSVSLEPMNPYERRIIHSALQNDKYVTTHSEGDEPFRRVVVSPKREFSNRNYSGRDSYRGGYNKGGYGASRSYNRGGYSSRYNNASDNNNSNYNVEETNSESTQQEVDE